MAKVEKQKVTEIGRKMPSEIVDEKAKEDAPPLRRKNKKTKDAGTSEAPVITPAASSVEQLAAKATERYKRVKEGL